ncbi:MAG: HigA family addiction module antitoxin [Rhodospirillales bacterium]
MPMKYPPHPGRLLSEELAALNLSVAEGARALGVSRSQLHRVVGGASAVSPEFALRIETVIGGGAGMWLRMQAAHDMACVRRRARKITRGLKRIRPAAA